MSLAIEALNQYSSGAFNGVADAFVATAGDGSAPDVSNHEDRIEDAKDVMHIKLSKGLTGFIRAAAGAGAVIAFIRMIYGLFQPGQGSVIQKMGGWANLVGLGVGIALAIYPNLFTIVVNLFIQGSVGLVSLLSSFFT